MDEAQRFLLDTSRLIPKWFLVMWHIFVLLIAGVGTIGLALQLNPAALLFVALGILMIGFMHATARGFQNPDRNFAQLTDDLLEVRFYRLFKPLTVEIPYSAVERIEQRGRHPFPQELFGFWPFYPWREHVDLKLRQRRFLTLVWGGAFPWVKTVHLQVMEPERFAAALRERIEHSGVSEPDGP
ncbi:MAG: hypothetical protein V3S20_08055 [Dehalococcoidia bacterium]